MKPTVRRAWIPVLALVLGAATGLVTPAHADCMGFGLRVVPDEAAPGDEVRARGKRFTTCEDVGYGCGPLPDPEPLRAIEIWFRQGGQATLLETVDADRDGRFDITVVIPEDAEPGNAMIDADGTARRIRVESPEPPIAD